MGDPITGASLGVLFAELYRGASKVIRNYIKFEPLLGDLINTLDALRPLIEHICAQNRLMRLPNELAESLERDIVRGLVLVRKYSNASSHSMVDCFGKATTYTSELRALIESLKKKSDMLSINGVWVTNATYIILTLLAEKFDVIPKDRFPKFTYDLVCYPTLGEDALLPTLTDAPLISSSQATQASLSAPIMMSEAVDVYRGEGSGAVRFKLLYDCLKEITNKSTINKPRFKGIISTLDSFRPIIEEFEYSSEDLGTKQEILEMFRLHVEQGIEAAHKYSRISKWSIIGRGKYVKVLCKWERSLRKQWESMNVQQRKPLAIKGSITSILDNEPPIYLLLQSNLYLLDQEKAVNKECFLDLGSFPEDIRSLVASLIHMWAELYDLGEEVSCIAILYELSMKSLANYVAARKNMELDGYYTTDDSVNQDDLLKDLAVYTTGQAGIEDRERLFVNINDNNFPDWWNQPRYLRTKARLSSITTATDGEYSFDWPNMALPEADILIMNPGTKKYALPDFVTNLANLKVLVTTNNNFKPPEHSNSQLLCSLPNIKRIRLEGISIPAIVENPIIVKSLLRISFFKCNIGQAFSKGSLKISYAFPYLEELNIDYCHDLVEVHALCDLILLKELVITNCRNLLALPEEIGALINLEMLSVRSCENLVALPGSVKDLKKVKFLDVSYCINLKELPKETGEMSNLRELSMIKCSSFQELPPSVANLSQLVKVICDEKTRHLWEGLLPSLTDTEILVIDVGENLIQYEQGSSLREIKQNSDSITEEALTSGVKGQSTSFPTQNQTENVARQTTSPMKIPKLRTVLPPRLCQPENSKKRLEHKARISSDDEPTPLSPRHNATYGIDESGHLSTFGMQDMYRAMQQFQLMSTRVVQSEKRVKMLESEYQNAEESWELEKQKLTAQRNLAMSQVASMNQEKDSLYEKIALLEKKEISASQMAQEILTAEWEPEFRREMQEAEKECFQLGCRVGFKLFFAKVEKKFPYLDFSDINQLEQIEFDMKVIENLLGLDSDDGADDDNNNNGSNHEERGGKDAAEAHGDVLERLHRHGMKNMNGSDTITVDTEIDVLGFAGSIYITREDVIQFKEMTPISAPCINVYMRHLYDVMKQPNKDCVFRFCDASNIWGVKTSEEKSKLLATRLHQLPTNKILLVPYNSGYHWTLTIINKEKDICYFMDPLHSPTYPEGWKSVVNNAIKKYKRSTRNETEWVTLKGPRQPSNVECGYYVMRYMKEIIEDPKLSFAEKWGCGMNLSAYTNREVDEVRLEWASLVYGRRPLVSG